MTAPREKLLRDPIHDLIVFDLRNEVDRLLLDLIDCAEVQRLRRIRQLGMAHYAFHGAEHSRFGHSIGVLHLVRRMLARLAGDGDVEPLMAVAVQCAGLLHDVGHGPFSHVTESFFGERHEAWSRRMIASGETEIGRKLRAFDPELPHLVSHALAGGLKPRWLNFLVSSQLDADRFDYLLRDSHMTGVKYGLFDLERLLLMLRVSEDGERLCVASKGLLPVEKYLQSRYHMYRQVYFHKTVTAAEAMLGALLERGAALAREGRLPGLAEDSPLHRVLAGDGDLALPDYLHLDDAAVLGALTVWVRGGDPVLADLSARLLNRRLFKSLEIADRDEQDLVIEMRMRAVEEILRGAGLDPEWYLVYKESSDTPYRPYNPRSEGPGGTIWIEDPERPGVLADVRDVSPTIRAFTESSFNIWRAFFPAKARGTDLRRDIVAAFNH